MVVMALSWMAASKVLRQWYVEEVLEGADTLAAVLVRVTLAQAQLVVAGAVVVWGNTWSAETTRQTKVISEGLVAQGRRVVMVLTGVL